MLKSPFRSRRRGFVQAVVVATGAWLLGGPGALAAPARPTELLGAYRFAGGQRERDALERAIDEVASEMSPLVRGIVRKKLRQATAIAAQLRIEADESHLTVRFDKVTWRAPLDGRRVPVKAVTGDDLELWYEVSERTIDQRFSGDEKGQHNRFWLDDDRLQFRARIFAEALPKDLLYGLTYERVTRVAGISGLT
jgi:hypothetical protein